MAGETPRERPLTRGAKFKLTAAACLIVFSCYLLMFTVMAFLLGLICLEVILCFAHVLAVVFGKIAAAHLKLLSAFVNSLRLREEADYQVALHPTDAPALWVVLENLCGRLALAIPDEVRIGMGANAFVRLDGRRRGAGRTTLAIGYDFFAGFSKSEFEAVVAHELAHAKLVQRGVRQWIGRGLARSTALAEALGNQVVYTETGKPANSLCHWLAKGARQMAIQVARRFAACSRQDEFEADRGAVELCGAAVFRHALSKSSALEQASERLPWRDRMARIDGEEDFGRWLADELASGQLASNATRLGETHAPYSTHPSLQDRLAALPIASRTESMDSTSALHLLALPNVIAGKLAGEILRLSALAEERDERELQRWTRRANSGTDLRPFQIGGVILFAVAGVLLLCWSVGGLPRDLLAGAVAASALGAVCFHSRLNLRPMGSVLPDFATALPVPPYAAFRSFWHARPRLNPERVKEIESEFKTRCLVQKKRQKLIVLVRECYGALASGDYLTAYVASDVALQCSPKCPEALLGQAVACAAFGLEERHANALAALQKLTGMREASVCWGTAWSLLLAGEWEAAEAWLGRTRQALPTEPVFWMLRAVCQAGRGKLQSAVANARLACDAMPQDRDKAVFLINLLLESGFLREAATRLGRFEADWTSHPELRMALIRLKVLRLDFEGAEEWISRHRNSPQSASALISLGALFHSVRGFDRSATFYREALSEGFCPEAFLGLGRLEVDVGNSQTAREHFLAALDINRVVLPECAGPLDLLPAVLEQILHLPGPEASCQAWTASLSPAFQPAALGKLAFLVFAPDITEAQQCLETILTAMSPGIALRPELITWELARSQPADPTRSGVYEAHYA